MSSRSRSLRTRREVVRRHRRERQFLVFGLLVGLLATVTVIAYAIYQGRVNSPITYAFVTPPPDFESSIKWPCAPLNEGNDENFPMEPSQVTVRVLNGTDKQGLAGSTLEVLMGRGYVPAASGAATNWNRTYSEYARIQFGEEGLRQAYTVAANFPEYVMVLDNREGAVIDIILGELFETNQIRPQYAPELDPGVELSAPVQCLPIDLVPREPAPRIIPVDPLAPIVTPSPSVTPSPPPAA
ncbi:LytR C-terminal domain-containing protein [Demequina sp.]|uniref:LytR C-terminal domain-containing protein n=1 Tax=Demequina sp. TaxID=2050685 RepID=UPI0025C0E4D4|nr:LytR C-terminal domain-containing protein [Demequina sp.]